MPVAVGFWFALAGGIAMLAGLSGLRQAGRLRRRGASAWATAVPLPMPAADDRPGRPRSRTLIQFALPDGRLIEQVSPTPVRKSARLEPGQRVLVWYDPASPQDVVVYGRDSRRADRAFLAAGIIGVAIGIAVAALGH
jgi:hypothetical protein